MSDSKIEIKKKKTTEFNEWYLEVVMKTGLLDYYQVSGCYIMLPYSYEIWEHIQNYLNTKFKQLGVKNVYFPLLIPETYLNKEKAHIDGFTPEVVWVSKTGNDTVDGVKLAIRPTSECAIYPTFSNIIKSFKDMPISWNQWCNVMRWEFNSPTPFVRSREFLWQEGHSCFTNKDDLYKNIKEMLQIYKKLYEEYLCVPIIVGKKVECEKFAGALETYSIETFIPAANKAIQCATVHNLGTNFSKMFNIKYETNASLCDDLKTDYVEQTSWGITTRSIGTMIMHHGDDKGLVFPPTVAPIQIVIIPIKYQKNPELNAKIYEIANELNKILSEKFRIIFDDSAKKPGWKYYHWESLGVPLRIEIGPKDVQNNVVTVHNRITNEKNTISIENMKNMDYVSELFLKTQKKLLENAKSSIAPIRINSFDEIGMSDEILLNKFMLTILCDDQACGNKIKNTYHLKQICRPVDLETLIVIDSDKMEKCVCCDKFGQLCYLSKTF